MKKIENGCQDKLDWFDGKHINEILFCQEFLKTRPMRCIGGTLFTVDGPVESEELVKRQIIDMVQSCVTTNLSKRASSLLESLKIQAYSEPLPVELDRIHCANGIYFLDGHFEPKKFFCNNRLSVSYNPDAPKPLRWLQFLSELLEEDDILTLQEYLGLPVHWNNIIAVTGRALKHEPLFSLLCDRSVAGVVAIYGASALVRRNLADYLFLRSEYVFFDFEEPLAYFFLDYCAIMGLFLLAGYGSMKLLRSK